MLLNLFFRSHLFFAHKIIHFNLSKVFNSFHQIYSITICFSNKKKNLLIECADYKFVAMQTLSEL